MMVYKLCREAEKRWRRLTGSQLLTRVLETTPHEYSVDIKKTSHLLLIPQSHAPVLFRPNI